ncbi:glycoside hydrolase family 15 protein [Streptomyces sp. NBC_01803]|uniref:glycoside hydrolase family 15 protein n=1 Tax=Streptomyces sp. NBC_01803 TaxID=2975946 RepID=UPI002DDA9B77|nr:glycoside hydrolase family 15 protein [Streptomyces sp. NBC_01803]WSA43589.1 glycoside hydrolase family 15 protein [Streptomyces sp. NBC_01803]
MANTSIGDYGLLSDRHSAALVSREGAVDWLCFPRFDSPAVFAALLDEGAGHWSIRPTAPARISRRYLDGTLVLRTEFRTDTGTLVLTDALATGPDEDPHRLGSAAPHLLVRRAACAEGTVEMAVDFRPRPEYGLVRPLLLPVDGGLMARGGATVLALTSPVPLTPGDEAATGTAVLRAGQGLDFALHWGSLSGPFPDVHPAAEVADQLAATIRTWRAWSDAHRTYDGPFSELVHHSGRVLQALSYQPTGAIVAAVTTSLPEEPGGERNWDYRYAWVRDSSFTMDALWVAACPDEADEFFAFLTSAAAAVSGARSRLQIMYGIGGEHDLAERDMPHLAGWRDSRPVRIGNDAWNQIQHDVYGEILSTASRFENWLDAGGTALRRFLPDLADAAIDVWHRPDHGIWEIRGEPRHFVYSKLMCWVALDRAVSLAGRLDVAADRVERWLRVAAEIQAAILTEGWSDEAGAFTQSFGGTELDACALTLPITGFLPADDPRVLSTLDAITAGLTDSRGMVHRYRTATGVDGLAGGEGSFLLCTFWLAQAQAMAGRVDAARATFARAADHANDLGLLAEQTDPASGRPMGNFPQAFSHVGLVNAAWSIARAEATRR